MIKEKPLMKLLTLRVVSIALMSTAIMVQYSQTAHAGITENRECKIWCNDAFNRCVAYHPTRVPACTLQSEACYKQCNRDYPTGPILIRLWNWLSPLIQGCTNFWSVLQVNKTTDPESIAQTTHDNPRRTRKNYEVFSPPICLYYDGQFSCPRSVFHSSSSWALWTRGMSILLQWKFQQLHDCWLYDNTRLYRHIKCM